MSGWRSCLHVCRQLYDSRRLAVELITDNILDRNFSAVRPNQAWVSDITYVSVIGGFEYLTTVIDLYNRKVVDYSISRTMKASDTVIPAFKMAIKARLSGIYLLGIHQITIQTSND